MFRCDDCMPVKSRDEGGWFEGWTGRSSEEWSIESMGEASGELPLDSAKSSLNTSGFDSRESDGLCERDGRDTDDSRDGDCRVAMMIVDKLQAALRGLVGIDGVPAARDGPYSRL